MARHHDPHVHWKHLAIYGVVMAVVIAIGAVALWSFFEKQSLIVAPEPLPKVTVVTIDANSRLAAAWVNLLTRAGLQATLVPLEKFDPIEGVVVFCDVPALPPRLAVLLETFVRRGGSLAFAGYPPVTPIGKLQLSAEIGLSDSSIKLSESVSPLLARLNPGSEVQMQRVPVALLKESPHMVVDARWRDKARAAVMHMEDGGARYVWMGFDPDALVAKDDRQILLLVRTAFRWVSGQPVSEGAVGAVALAKTLTAESRREARAERFTFSVERLSNRRYFLLRMTNRGGRPIENPSVMVWMPPLTTEVVVAGDFLMKRNLALTAMPEDRAWVISVPDLARNEDRMVKLKITTAPR
ncbi:MAG: hypothetical protein QOC81_3399 [Thermoanaerobaculia bacterium]|jgi:hypothetical protein|nr:hypothetical protein [Thermoanaerobaculia bacterium]